MSILITGGTGFIGSFLARHLLNNSSEQLVLLDYFINQKRITDIIQNERVEIIQGDISNWSELISLGKSIDSISTIYHFASIMPPVTENKLEVSFRVNIQGTFNILEYARYFGVSKVIYASSGAVYGPGVDISCNKLHKIVHHNGFIAKIISFY
ncbi:MAG: NAD-dependent epimerase/dehydratase family protein [Candidatus Hodarchaeota archaeon]